MFGRRIHCEASGVHRVTTERLELISGRASGEAQYDAICTEPADGPAKFTLPDGRVIDSMWWSHRDPGAKRHCDRLYATIDLADAAAQAGDLPPEAPAPSTAGPLR